MSEKTKSAPDLDLLQELEGQKQSDVDRMRTHERVNVRAKMVVQPANSSDTSRIKVQGMTCDLSMGGCRAVFPMPLGVGDVYRIQLDLENVCIPLVFARCLRCRLVNETTFEVGFSFFTPIQLGDQSVKKVDSKKGGGGLL
ncbi:MAG: PilZ domain-containing protein [Planctomycetota bacterium]